MFENQKANMTPHVTGHVMSKNLILKLGILLLSNPKTWYSSFNQFRSALKLVIFLFPLTQH